MDTYDCDRVVVVAPPVDPSKTKAQNAKAAKLVTEPKKPRAKREPKPQKEPKSKEFVDECESGGEEKSVRRRKRTAKEINDELYEQMKNAVQNGEGDGAEGLTPAFWKAVKQLQDRLVKPPAKKAKSNADNLEDAGQMASTSKSSPGDDDDDKPIYIVVGETLRVPPGNLLDNLKRYFAPRSTT